MRALGTNPTEAEVHRLCQDYMKKDDRISFDTFLPILQTVSSKKITDTVEDFVEGLRHFDKDGNGFITSAELRHLLTSMHIALIIILMHTNFLLIFYLLYFFFGGGGRESFFKYDEQILPIIDLLLVTTLSFDTIQYCDTITYLIIA